MGNVYFQKHTPIELSGSKKGSQKRFNTFEQFGLNMIEHGSIKLNKSFNKSGTA